jgi:carboxylesterase type B
LNDEAQIHHFSLFLNNVGLTAAQSVRTSGGTMIGKASSSVPTVSQWLGVPFAQAPLRANRWLKPQTLNSTKELRADTQAA